jgi:hypothetical protein
MMLKPPSANMPGVTDTLEFVKNLWGSMNLPGASLSGMSTPPMSVEDLDKRIADLRAVESWLNMNVTMLRGTIQTMEIQRATLANLKSMGASMAEAMRQSGVSAEKMASMPFGSLFGQAAPGADTGGGGSAQAGAGGPAQEPGAALGMSTAIAWWNMLQEQFTHAVAAAMTPPDGAAGQDAQRDAPAAQPKAESAPEAKPQVNGSGRARGGKPKGDKA